MTDFALQESSEIKKFPRCGNHTMKLFSRKNKVAFKFPFFHIIDAMMNLSFVLRNITLSYTRKNEENKG